MHPNPGMSYFHLFRPLRARPRRSHTSSPAIFGRLARRPPLAPVCDSHVIRFCSLSTLPCHRSISWRSLVGWRARPYTVRQVMKAWAVSIYPLGEALRRMCVLCHELSGSGRPVFNFRMTMCDFRPQQESEDMAIGVNSAFSRIEESL